MTKISFLLHETQKSKVCIPDDVGIEALLHYFETRPIEVLPPNEFLLSLTEIILSRNFFQYAGAYYLQRPGVRFIYLFSTNFFFFPPCPLGGSVAWGVPLVSGYSCEELYH